MTSEQGKNLGNIDLERVIGTTIGYGIIGSFFPDSHAVAPTLAVTGLALSIYDELKQTGLDLARPIWGAALGGFAGSFFDINSNSYLPNIVTYTSTAIFGTLGFIKSLHNKGDR